MVAKLRQIQMSPLIDLASQTIQTFLVCFGLGLMLAPTPARADDLAPKSRLILLDPSVERASATLSYRVCAPAGQPLSCKDYTFATPDAPSRATVMNSIFLLQTATNARVPVMADFSSTAALQRSVEEFRKSKLSHVDAAVSGKIQAWLTDLAKEPGCYEGLKAVADALARTPFDPNYDSPPADQPPATRAAPGPSH